MNVCMRTHTSLRETHRLDGVPLQVLLRDANGSNGSDASKGPKSSNSPNRFGASAKKSPRISAHPTAGTRTKKR